MKPPACDDDRCCWDGTKWVHETDCRTRVARWTAEDMSLSTAKEDGYSEAYGVRYDGLPAAWEAAA